jgi:hypothetical protein
MKTRQTEENPKKDIESLKSFKETMRLIRTISGKKAHPTRQLNREKWLQPRQHSFSS